MSGEERIYCCDEHGRPFIFRTIDGKVRRIAITANFITRLLNYAESKNLLGSEASNIKDMAYSLIEALEKREEKKLRVFLEEKGGTFLKLLRAVEKDLLESGVSPTTMYDMGIYDLMHTVDKFKRKFSWSPPVTVEEELKAAKETLELIKKELGMSLDRFLSEDLENLTFEDPKEKTKERPEAREIREAVLLFIFESIKRRIIVEKALEKNDIEKALRDAAKEFLIEIHGVRDQTELERLAQNFLTRCNKDIVVILLGSSAKYAATPESDIELFLYSEKFVECGVFAKMKNNKLTVDSERYWNFLIKLKESIARRLGFIKQGTREEELLVDLRIGTPELISALAKQETNRSRRERGVFWAFTPVTDGIILGNNETLVDRLAPRLTEIAQTMGKGADLYKWGVRHYRNSISGILRELGRGRHPEKLYRYFDLLMRALAIKNSVNLDGIRDAKAKPYWFMFESTEKLHWRLRGNKRLKRKIKSILVNTIRFRAKLLNEISYQVEPLWGFLDANFPPRSR